MITRASKQHGLFGLLAILFIGSVMAALYSELIYLLAIPFLFLLFYAGWQQPRLLFFLLLASLPFSFEYNFSSSLSTDIPDEFLMLVTAFLFFAYCCFYPAALPAKILRHPLIQILLIWMLWILVSVIFSTDPQISLKYLLAKTWYLAAFVLAALVVSREKKWIILSAAICTASMMMVMLIILARHYGSDFSFATVNEAVFPFFRNHVNYSAMLVCLLPALVAFFFGIRNGKLKLFLGILIAITLFALVTAYARGAWAALLAGMLAYWLTRKKLLVISAGLAFLLILASIFWVKQDDRYLQYAPDFKTTIFHKNFDEHLVATYKLKDVSTAERFYRWIAGIRMIKDEPLTGTGPNTFYEHYKSYTIPAYKTWVSDNPERSGVHNYFLLLTIEQGIPGLVIFLLLVMAMLYYAQKIYHSSENKFNRSIALTVAVMLVMIITLNFLSDLIETDKIGSLFFLCVSLLVIVEWRKVGREVEEWRS